MWPFKSKDEKVYKGNILDLHVVDYEVGNEYNHYIPCVYYEIYLHNTEVKVGRCDLRLGMSDEIYYYGQVGYSIYRDFRGNHYAYYACLMLFDILYSEYLFDEVIITCSPDNIASYKTLEKLNGQLIETVDVPKDHPLYQYRKERIKCIYKFNLRDRYAEV